MNRRVAAALVALVLLGLGVRYAALATAPACRAPDVADLASVLGGQEPPGEGCVLLSDAAVYRAQAQDNADGRWFQSVRLAGGYEDSALHPPLFPLLLTPLVAAGVDGFDALRAVVVLLGAVTIAGTGLLGRRLAGDRAGLVAAGLVAVHPMVWLNDIGLLSEALVGPAALLVTWTALRLHDDPTVRRGLEAGAAVGAAALVRSEAILFLAVLAVPLLARATRAVTGARLRALGAAAGAALLVVGLWVGPNLVRFHRPVLFTTTAGISAALANCEATYGGDRLGSREATCLREATSTVPVPPDADQSDLDRALVDHAVDEARADPGGASAAALARVGRMWGLYAPFGSIEADDPIEGRGVGRSQLAVVLGWEVMAAGAWGAVLLRRRGTAVAPLLGWVVTSSAVALVNLGLHRFRAPAEIALCLLAAVAVDHLLGGRSPLGGRRRSG